MLSVEEDSNRTDRRSGHGDHSRTNTRADALTGSGANAGTESDADT